MKARDFVYWLQGYFEISNGLGDNVPEIGLTPNQVKTIRNHLNMVFVHEIDPSYGDEKDLLQKIHDSAVASSQKIPDAKMNC